VQARGGDCKAAEGAAGRDRPAGAARGKTAAAAAAPAGTPPKRQQLVGRLGVARAPLFSRCGTVWAAVRFGVFPGVVCGPVSQRPLE